LERVIFLDINLFSSLLLNVVRISVSVLERTPLELDRGICYTLGLERNKK
jgi:hypothetical protein